MDRQEADRKAFMFFTREERGRNALVKNSRGAKSMLVTLPDHNVSEMMLRVHVEEGMANIIVVYSDRFVVFPVEAADESQAPGLEIATDLSVENLVYAISQHPGSRIRLKVNSANCDIASFAQQFAMAS